MSLKDQLTSDLKSALKAGDERRKNVVRSLLAAIKHAEVEKRAALAKRLSHGAATEAQLAELERVALGEDEVLGPVQKEAKARREAAADAHQAGRADLVAENEAELALIEGYLPPPLTREELIELARTAIAEAGATDLKQLGAVMKLLAPRTKGRADGKLVSDIAREVLGG